MFDPNSEDNGEFELEQVDNSSKLGNKELYRKSNENLYNIKHQNKFGGVDNDKTVKEIKNLALAVTNYKRAQFNKLKAEQRELPAD